MWKKILMIGMITPAFALACGHSSKKDLVSAKDTHADQASTHECHGHLSDRDPASQKQSVVEQVSMKEQHPHEKLGTVLMRTVSLDGSE